MVPARHRGQPEFSKYGCPRGADGQIVASRPLEAQPWFDAATWIGQIMPLFFALGGFTAYTAWQSLRRRDGDYIDFVRGRVLRLARPALPLFVFFAVALGIATAIGVDPSLLDTIATGAGSPLWFLAAFLLAQSFAPAMVRLHAAAPRASLAVLLAGAVLVDALRFATGGVEVGLVNLVFVWFYVQQLGFWHADGWFRARRPWQLIALATVAYAMIAGIVAAGWASPDMLRNLNPPTVPVALLSVAQLALLTLRCPHVHSRRRHDEPVPRPSHRARRKRIGRGRRPVASPSPGLTAPRHPTLSCDAPRRWCPAESQNSSSQWYSPVETSSSLGLFGDIAMARRRLRSATFSLLSGGFTLEFVVSAAMIVPESRSMSMSTSFPSEPMTRSVTRSARP
jgi:hypothetical protein